MQEQVRASKKSIFQMNINELEMQINESEMAAQRNERHDS